MYTMNKIITATLMLVAFTGLAAASAADMTIFPKESSTRIDSFTSYEVTVENVGPVKDVYDIGSNSPREVSIAPKQVELQPGAEETVNVWYNPQINKEEGTYSFQISATSQASGESYSVEGLVNVIKDHKVAVTVDDYSKTGCVSGKTTYTVKVTNNGIQKEEFDLSTEYGELSRNRVTLEDGETQEVKLVTESNQAVQKNFNVVAASTTSYAQDIKNVEYNSEVCYASDVNIKPQQNDVAAMDKGSFKINVQNTGTKMDTFQISSNIGEVDEMEMSIPAKSTRSTVLGIDKKQTQELGNKNIQVSVKSKAGEKSASAQMTVYNGMDSRVTMDAKNKAICEKESTTFEATVKNTGEAEETYSVSTSMGEIEEDEVTLKEGKSRTLEVSIPENVSIGTHDVNVEAAAQTFGEPVKSSTSTLAVENCWDLKMNVVPEVASAGENRSTIYEINLNNTGTKENTYELSYKGPEWIEIKPQQVTVPAGENRKAYMYAGVPFQKKGEVTITANAVGKQIQKSQDVDLVIGKEIEEAIKSDKGGSITGNFANSVTGFVKDLGSANIYIKAAISIIVGFLITAAVLLRER